MKQENSVKNVDSVYPVTIRNTRNPVLPLSVHIPDSEAHVMPDGRLCIYGSFDNGDILYCSDEYHVVTTPDMKEWTVHEKSLDGNDIEWCYNPAYPHYPGIDWEHPTPFIRKMLEEHTYDKEAFETNGDEVKPKLLFAPDCIFKNGKYYLYFCMADDTEGVAVSDRPEGPFKDWKQLPVGGIDPAVFVDRDGSAYYYWGQLFSHGVKLNEDMASFDSADIRDSLVTEEEHFFHEGSSMRRIGDTYYFVYASIAYGRPTSLAYATSDSPLGPFTYRGVIINNEGCDPQSWNNHGSIECINGQWYVFYHRCSRGTKLFRRLCIEKITVLPDGTIPEVKMTSQGIGDPFAPGECIKAYEACTVRGGCYIGLSEEGEPWPEKLTNLKAGNEAVFRYIQRDPAYSKIQITAGGGGRVSVMMDGKRVGTVQISADSDIRTFCGEISPEAAAAARDESKAAGTEGIELTLCIEESEELEIFDITMEA